MKYAHGHGTKVPMMPYDAGQAQPTKTTHQVGPTGGLPGNAATPGHAQAHADQMKPHPRTGVHHGKGR